ncbi:chalcone isomerase family protein [Alteromonas sp. CYL-A6]|uniref:chalcone isomerase family protein n=1 Tax=Alteromonas nitratireducens TaxID=3390813 RepID=UPI0034B19950
MLTINVASAMPSVVVSNVDNAAPVGEAMFTYYFWDVYQATLYAPQGDWPATPYALALTYQRDFEGKAIAEKSIEEMRKQGLSDEQKARRWLELMASLFPDVGEDETLVGVVTPEQHTRFYKGDELLGEVEDKEFTERFFAIWLSEKTSEPDFRNQLLNLNKE